MVDAISTIIGLAIQGVVILALTTAVNLGIFARPKDVDDAKAEVVDRDDRLKKELMDVIDKNASELNQRMIEAEKIHDKFMTKEVCEIKHSQVEKIEIKVDRLDEKIGNIEKQNASMCSTIELIHETMTKIVKTLSNLN